MKKAVLILFLSVCSYSYSQQSQCGVRLTIHHDAKLLLIGDDKGNDPVTLNLLVKLEFPFKEFYNSYLFAYPSIEYASLLGGNYQRYAVGVGYVVNDVFKNFNMAVSSDYGSLKRADKYSGYSLNLSGEIAYRLSRTLQVSYIYQVAQRPDLKALYNSKTDFIGSGFIGIKMCLL